MACGPDHLVQGWNQHCVYCSAVYCQISPECWFWGWSVLSCAGASAQDQSNKELYASYIGLCHISNACRWTSSVRCLQHA